MCLFPISLNLELCRYLLGKDNGKRHPRGKIDEYTEAEGKTALRLYTYTNTPNAVKEIAEIDGNNKLHIIRFIKEPKAAKDASGKPVNLLSQQVNTPDEPVTFLTQNPNGELGFFTEGFTIQEAQLAYRVINRGLHHFLIKDVAKTAITTAGTAAVAQYTYEKIELNADYKTIQLYKDNPEQLTQETRKLLQFLNIAPATRENKPVDERNLLVKACKICLTPEVLESKNVGLSCTKKLAAAYLKYELAHDILGGKDVVRALHKSKGFESSLLQGIYRGSKLGKYSAIFSVTALYYPHYSEDKKTGQRVKTETYVEYSKAFAFGEGFIGDINDLKKHYTPNNDMVESIKNEYLNEVEFEVFNERSKNEDFLFVDNPDEALTNYVDLIIDFLKEHEIKRTAIKGKGSNVLYLINITGNLVGLNASQTKIELINITKKANDYFKRLRVTTRVALYEGSPKNFKFHELGKNEGVIFIGGVDRTDSKDMAKAIDNFSKPPKNVSATEYNNNKIFVKDLRSTKSMIGGMISVSYINDFDNPERSMVFSRHKMNRIIVHYGRTSSLITAKDFGLSKSDKSRSIKLSAWCIVHGQGIMHNQTF